jgi:hypothetical protein
MDEVKGLGRALFAAVLLMVGGVLNIIYGIAAIGNSHFFAHNAHYVFANLKTWGWVSLLIGILEVIASLSLFAGGTFGRFFGIGVGALAAIGALLSIPAYPFWSLAVFALSIYIIYGLAIFSKPEESVAAADSERAAGPVMSGGPRSPM